MHLQRAGALRAGRTQPVKWTMEGAVKGRKFRLSILRRSAHTLVAGEYDSILIRAGILYPYIYLYWSDREFLNQGGTAKIIRP